MIDRERRRERKKINISMFCFFFYSSMLSEKEIKFGRRKKRIESSLRKPVFNQNQKR